MHSRLAQFYAGMMMPAMQNLNTLNYVIVTIVGGLLALFRGFDVGGLAAFLQYSRQFGRPINELSVLYNNIQAAVAGAERIFQLLDQKPESDSTESRQMPLCVARFVFGRFGLPIGRVSRC